MAMARLYQTFEVREMLQKAEGASSPVTGVAAHSRVLHAQATPGGVGTTPGEMMLRTHKQVGESNTQFSNRGGTTRTSAFNSLMEQADAVCQALNSTQGQSALQVFDAPAHAAKKLRATIDFGPIKQFGFLDVGAGAMKTVHKTDADVQDPGGGAAGVRVILDRGANGTTFHIQTSMPLDTLAGTKFEVKEGNSLIIAG